MKITEENIQLMLDSIYDNVLLGLPGTESIFELADVYLEKNAQSVESAAEQLIKAQIAKCALSGFLSSVGGAIVLSFSVPVDLAATYYMQMRMSAAVAHMYGHDVKSEEVRTMVYLSLIGEEGRGVLRGFSQRAIKSLSKEMIVKVNTILSKKLMLRFGPRLGFSFARLVPIAGGFVGAGLNSYYCSKVGQACIELFSHDDAKGRNI